MELNNVTIFEKNVIVELAKKLSLSYGILYLNLPKAEKSTSNRKIDIN